METAPFYDDIAFGPVGGAAHWLRTPDGIRIRVGHWTGDNVKGTVLLFPGRTEYIEKYGDAAGELLQRGYATVAVDWRGQGIADRLIANKALGHVGAFSDYQIDVQTVLAHVEALDLPKPYYLIGHSLGGCIGLRALHNGLPVNAAAFSAPMWGIGIAPAMRPIAWVMSYVAQALGLGNKIVPMQHEETYVLREDFVTNTLTRDQEMWERLGTQLTAYPDLALGGPTLQWLNLSLREMRTLFQMPSPDVPCVTFLGTREDIVDPERIKDRMARWPNGALEIVPEGEHEVMLEIPASRQMVFDKIAAHFDAHP